MSLPVTAPVKCLLDLLDRCDTFYPATTPVEGLVGRFIVDDSVVGYVCTGVVDAVREHEASTPTPVFVLRPSEGTEIGWTPTTDILLGGGAGQGFDERTAKVKAVVDSWRAADRLAPLRGWRNEEYPVYAGGVKAAFTMERAAASLFGILTYGVHVNIYIGGSSPGSGMPLGQGWRMWIARRSLSKPTYPGMLDNSVAGGIPYGLSPREAMVKECDEEASLSEPVASKATAVGAISYANVTSKGIQPEVQYVYDLPIPAELTLSPNDGEVHSFTPMDQDELIAALLSGAFKPNCALVILDFLLRHGILTPETEPAYISLTQRLHRTLGLPGPHGHSL